MAELRRRFPLETPDGTDRATTLRGGDVCVEALPLMGHVLIQLPPECAAEHLRAAIELPATPNRCVGGDPITMWLGPRSWVAITAAVDAATMLAARVEAVLQPMGGHAVELSDAHQTFRVTGPAATWLLGQGCALDLEGASGEAGAATRTSIARMPSILHCMAPQAFMLHVDRSLAHQFWDWFGRGVREMAALATIPDTATR